MTSSIAPADFTGITVSLRLCFTFLVIPLNTGKCSLLLLHVANSNTRLFCCSAPVDRRYRSRMNIPFRVGTGTEQERLEKGFLQEAQKLKMVSLKGHRSVGGMRASLYNAVTVEETRMLAEFMEEYQDTSLDKQ